MTCMDSRAELNVWAVNTGSELETHCRQTHVSTQLLGAMLLCKKLILSPRSMMSRQVGSILHVAASLPDAPEAPKLKQA